MLLWEADPVKRDFVGTVLSTTAKHQQAPGKQLALRKQVASGKWSSREVSRDISQMRFVRHQRRSMGMEGEVFVVSRKNVRSFLQCGKRQLSIYFAFLENI